MRIGKSVFALLGVVGLSVSTMAWAQSETVMQRVAQKGRFVIAFRDGVPPFAFVDADKKPTGYSVDLCLKLAEVVRKKANPKTFKVEFLPVTPTDRVQVIAEGRADLECGVTGNNAERREKAAFTVPHFITGARFMVKEASKAAKLEDFSGRKVAVIRGTSSAQAVERLNRERNMSITVIEAVDFGKAADMVRSGEVDALLWNDVQIYGAISNLPNAKEFKLVGQAVSAEALAIMLPKGDAEFKKIIDDEMKRMILSGEIYPIYDKWFTKPAPPNGKNLNMPVPYLLKDFWKYPSDFVPF